MTPDEIAWFLIGTAKASLGLDDPADTEDAQDAQHALVVKLMATPQAKYITDAAALLSLCEAAALDIVRTNP